MTDFDHILKAKRWTTARLKRELDLRGIVVTEKTISNYRKEITRCPIVIALAISEIVEIPTDILFAEKVEEVPNG